MALLAARAALAFYGQNKTDQMWLVCFQVQVEFRCQHWNWGIALVLIIKYLFKENHPKYFP